MNDEPFDSTFLRNKLFEFKLGASTQRDLFDAYVTINSKFS
jgi:hypothetical protein